MATINKEITTTEEVEIEIEVSELAYMYNEMDADEQSEFRDQTELNEEEGTPSREAVMEWLDSESGDDEIWNEALDNLGCNEDNLDYLFESVVDTDDEDIKKVVAKHFGENIKAEKKETSSEEDVEEEVVLQFVSDHCLESEFLEKVFEHIAPNSSDLQLFLKQFNEGDEDAAQVAAEYFGLEQDEEVNVGCAAVSVDVAPCEAPTKKKVQEEAGSEVDRKYQRVLEKLREKFTVEQLEAVLKIQL